MIYIESERLTLSPIRPDHWSLFLRLHQDESVIRYVLDYTNIEDIRQRFEDRLPEWKWGDEHWSCLVIRDRYTGESFGIIGFQVSDDGTSAEIGYLLLKECHGKGIGTESVFALINYLEHYVPIMEIRAIVTSGNKAGCHILEKANFTLQDIQPLAFQIAGEWYDDLIYCYQIKRRH